MTRVLVAALLTCLLVAPISGMAQVAPVAVGTDALSWYADAADLANARVLRFEVNYDDAGWMPVGLPTTTDPDTPAGFQAFRIAFAALQPGAHRVIVRACNAEICSDPSVPFTFTLTIVPSAPTGVHLLGGR